MLSLSTRRKRASELRSEESMLVPDMPVIVEFFASGSLACRAQLKQLMELHDRYADQGLAIFALAVDRFETPEADKDVESLILTMRLPFPVGAATRELANDYHYKGVPAKIVLNRFSSDCIMAANAVRSEDRLVHACSCARVRDRIWRCR